MFLTGKKFHVHVKMNNQRFRSEDIFRGFMNETCCKKVGNIRELLCRVTIYMTYTNVTFISTTTVKLYREFILFGMRHRCAVRMQHSNNKPRSWTWVHFSIVLLGHCTGSQHVTKKVCQVKVLDQMNFVSQNFNYFLL